MALNRFLKVFAGAGLLISLYSSSALADPPFDSFTVCASSDPIPPSDPLYFDFNYNDCASDATTAALAKSYQDIGTDQQNSQISRALAGGHNGGVLAIFPSGRLMQSNHDGLLEELSGVRLGGFEANEFSAFINAAYDVPGIVFGGQLKLAGLVGGLHLSVNQDPVNIFSSESDNDSFFIGGSSVWSQGSFYSSSTFIYFTGTTEAKFFDGTGFGEIGSDTDGYVSNSVMGYVFDVPSAGENVKFDLRGVIGNAKANDDFRESNNPAAFNFASRATELDIWHGTISGMFFSLIPTADGGVSRPFVQLSYKRLFSYDHDATTELTLGGGTLFQSFDQAKDYGRIDVGFDHVSGPYTFGSAIYVEASEDESTIGGRLGVSYKFSSGE